MAYSQIIGAKSHSLSMINNSLVCVLLLMGDILLGVNYLKKNKWIMYTSQICFYAGACLAVGVL